MAAPSNSFNRALLHPKHWLTWLMLLAVWAYTYVPAPIRLWLMGKVGLMSLRLSKGRERAVKANLSLCFPESSIEQREQWMRAYAKNAGFAAGEMAWIWFRSLKTIKARTHLVGEEHLKCAQATHRPIIFLVPHTLFLEYGAFCVAQEVPCAGIFNTFKNPVLDWLVLRRRQKLTDHIIPRQSGKTIQTMTDLAKQNYAIYHLMDEDLGVKRSVFAPLFGTPKATLANMADMIRDTQAVVVPCSTHYDKTTDNMVVTLDAPIDLTPIQNDAVAVATRINAAYEVMLTRCREHYMWSLRLFRNRPEGDAREFYSGEPKWW